MDIARWNTTCEYVVNSLYGEDLAKRDAMIDAMISPDAKLDQFSFSVQGRSSIKRLFNVYRMINKGQSIIEKVDFCSKTKTVVVSFNQELDLRIGYFSKKEYSAFTIFHLREIEEDRWMVYQIKDIVDPHSLISTVPFVGSLYNSFARPLAGAALVALGGFYDGSSVQTSSNRGIEDMTIMGGNQVSENRALLSAQTQNYLRSIERVGQQASLASSGGSSAALSGKENGKNDSDNELDRTPNQS